MYFFLVASAEANEVGEFVQVLRCRRRTEVARVGSGVRQTVFGWLNFQSTAEDTAQTTGLGLKWLAPETAVAILATRHTGRIHLMHFFPRLCATTRAGWVDVRFRSFSWQSR